jgi:hypothetical protein
MVREFRKLELALTRHTKLALTTDCHFPCSVGLEILWLGRQITASVLIPLA